MDKEELDARALFKVGDPVHWRSTVCRITGRYWRRSEDVIMYDLQEVVKPPARGRDHKRVPERELRRPSLHTLGLAADPSEQRVRAARSRRS